MTAYTVTFTFRTREGRLTTRHRIHRAKTAKKATDECLMFMMDWQLTNLIEISATRRLAEHIHMQ